MQVRHILEIKGREVATIPGATTLLDATRALARRRIGALVVTDAEGGLAGIISERDLVRAIARYGAPALDDAVSRHMTSAVVTATRKATIDSLAEQMTAGRFRHMPIVEGGRLCGIVSIGDAVKWRVEQIEIEHKALREYIASA